MELLLQIATPHGGLTEVAAKHARMDHRHFCFTAQHERSMRHSHTDLGSSHPFVRSFLSFFLLCLRLRLRIRILHRAGLECTTCDVVQHNHKDPSGWLYAHVVLDSSVIYLQREAKDARLTAEQ